MIEDSEQRDQSAEEKPKDAEQKILVLAIGGGGGRVAADLLKGSDHFRKLVGSVYFLNTNKKDLDEIFNNDIKEIEGKIVKTVSEETSTPNDLISVGKWWYGHTGAGGDFIRSERMLLYWLFHKEYVERISEQGLDADSVGDESSELGDPFGDGYRDFKNMAEGIMNNMKDEIRENDMILLIHSLGGGTGGGGAPVLARYLTEEMNSEYMKDRIVVSLCFLADLHEEALTKANSIRNLMEISRAVDIVLLFSNENLIDQVQKERIVQSYGEKFTFRKLNSLIVSAVEVLMTAMYEDKITKPLDFHDLKSFSLGLPTNIVIPFMAPDYQNVNLKVPCLDHCLDFSLVPFTYGRMAKILPIIISSTRGIEQIDEHPKDMYEEVISKKLMVDMRGYVGDVRGVLDDVERNPMKVLALGFGLADLAHYLDYLTDATYQWKAFHEEAGTKEPLQQTEQLIREIRQWYDDCSTRVESFIKDRAGGME